MNRFALVGVLAASIALPACDDNDGIRPIGGPLIDTADTASRQACNGLTAGLPGRFFCTVLTVLWAPHPQPAVERPCLSGH